MKKIKDSMKLKLNCQLSLSQDDKLQYASQVNPNLIPVEILVMSVDTKANWTTFSKDTIMNAIPSLYGIPIVAEYVVYDNEKAGLGSHSNDMYNPTTSPIGFIDSSVKVNFKNVELENGMIKEFLCITGFLWSEDNIGLNPQVQHILKHGANQSMEIAVFEGFWEDGDELVVTEFEFNALCALNKDTTGDNDVKPAFEGAEIKILSEKPDDAIYNNAQFDVKNIMDSISKLSDSIKNNDKNYNEIKEMLINYNQKTEESKGENTMFKLPQNASLVFKNDSTIIYCEDGVFKEINYTKDEDIDLSKATILDFTIEAETIETIPEDYIKLDEGQIVVDKAEYEKVKAEYEASIEKVKEFEMKEKENKFSELLSLYDLDAEDDEVKAVKENIESLDYIAMDKELKLIWANKNFNKTKAYEKNNDISSLIKDDMKFNKDENDNKDEVDNIKLMGL